MNDAIQTAHNNRLVIALSNFATTVTSPIVFLAKKIGQLAHYLFFYQFVGYFVHLGVFSYPSWENSFFKRKFIDFFNFGPKGLFCAPYDTKRVNHAIDTLKKIGESKIINSPVGKLDTLHIRYKDVKTKIEANGGQILEHVGISDIVTVKKGKHATTTCSQSKNAKEFANVIIPGKDLAGWNACCKEVLNHLGLESVELKLNNGQVVKGFISWTGTNSKKSQLGQCFVRFNSPGERFATAKRDIMRRVLAGQDAFCFDPPGSGASEKTTAPSEGAYYVAADAVYAHVKGLGYNPSKIWLDGFCMGGAVGTYVWCKHQDEGVNFFGQNNFDNMSNVFRKQVFPANYLAPHAIEAIKNPKINVPQDGLDSVEKLKNLQVQQKKGKVVLVNTPNDKSINLDSPKLLSDEWKKSASSVDVVWCRNVDHKVDGHRSDVLSRDTFQRAWTIIAA